MRVRNDLNIFRQLIAPDLLKQLVVVNGLVSIREITQYNCCSFIAHAINESLFQFLLLNN